MPEPVYKLEDLNNSLQITIRCRKHWPTIIWSAACISVTIPLVGVFPTIISNSGAGVLVFIMLVPVIIGVSALCGLVLAWQLDGEEVLKVNSQKLEIGRSSFGLTSKQIIRLESIKAIKAMPTEHDLGFRWSYLRPGSAFVYNSGRIAIEQEKRIYRVGSGLDFEEAEEIVKSIQVGRYRLKSQEAKTFL